MIDAVAKWAVTFVASRILGGKVDQLLRKDREDKFIDRINENIRMTYRLESMRKKHFSTKKLEKRISMTLDDYEKMTH